MTVIDPTALLSVSPEHGGGLVAEHVALDGDATLFEQAYPLRGLRSFLEANLFGVLAAGVADEVPYTGPGSRTEAHGARLGAGDQLVRGLPLPTQVEVPDDLLGYHDRYPLRVGERVA